MKFGVVTLFEAQLRALFEGGVVGNSLEQDRLQLICRNPREFASGGYRRVDDRPFGGGPGMVMQYEPVAHAIEALVTECGPAKVIGLTPQGRPFSQADARRLSLEPAIVLVAGRYEGIDERVAEQYFDEEISLGDFVLSGGEIAAAAIIDATARLLPGVLGHVESASEDSFSAGLLDWPHYTRPETIGDRQVPEVLLSGDHKAIARWRRQQALGRTWQRRPDLLAELTLDATDQQLLEEFKAAQAVTMK